VHSLNSCRSVPVTIYRPALLVGLYFFLSPAVSAPVRESSLLQVFSPLFVEEPYALAEYTDSSFLRLRSTFNPLYSEKDRATDGSRRTISAATNGYSAEWFSHLNRVQYFLSYSHDAGSATYRDSVESYGWIFRQKEWNLTAGTAYRYRNLQFGFALGRHWPQQMEREHLYEIRDNMKKYLARGPWRYSLDAEMLFSAVTARLSLFSGPIHSSVTKLNTTDETSYRSFPLSLIRHRADAGIAVQSGPADVSFTFEIDYYENGNLQTVRNSMPQDIAISNYRMMHHGRSALPFTDSLGWYLSGAIAGGWVASYNFDRDRFTFFKSEKMRLNTLFSGIGIKLPVSLTAGMFQSLVKGTSPTGFLKLSALSAWSVFQPLDYRYTNAYLHYRETGGFIRRDWRLSHCEFTPRINLSYIEAHATAAYSHKEIVVLFPVYVDTVSEELLNTQLLLLEPSLSVSVRLYRIHLRGTIAQMLPFFFAGGTSPASFASSQTDQHDEMSIAGGTRIAVTATWHVPSLDKQK
jgi:hypothetical protein